MQNNETNPHFETRPYTLIEKKYFVGQPIDQKPKYFLFKGELYLKHHFFKDTGAKKFIFKNVDFSFSVFDNAYFHQCQFEDCSFIGAKFNGCNLRNSIFTNCKFEYSVFSGTEVPYRELLANLSSWPNANREWLRRLRINFESTGNIEAVKACVREEMTASREHLKKAREAKEGYYAKSYKGFWKQIPVRWESFRVFLDWHLWGHGEYPFKLFITVLAILLVASVYVVVDHFTLNDAPSLRDVSYAFLTAFRDVGYTFVGLPQGSIAEWLAATLSLIRYIALGLFISVLYKNIARR
jgi:hypothetical protein